MSERTSHPIRNLLAGSATALALVGGLLTAPAQAEPVKQAAVIECPTAVPLDTVTAGMIGEGYTVTRGTTPQPFKVEVLGKLTNGIGAGRDMIIIEASDLPGGNVIAQGGIWFGMSGSPVYVDGQLLGAVSYGFSASTSSIGGVTPAAYMYDLLDLGGAAAQKAEPAQAKKVSLSAKQRSTIAARADAAVPKAALQPLRVPLSVSGLAPQRLNRLQSDADKAGLNVRVHAGSSAAAPAAAAPLVQPTAGGNFASTLSYGDVTASGVGTTTAVCEDQALAWGHPFNYLGPVTYGAHNATSLAIIKDETFGPFKLAEIGAPIGTVDQDRLSGIRADLSAAPVTTPITTDITNYDTKKNRTGSTEVAYPEFLAEAALNGIWAGYDNVFDEIGSGRANGTWTIKGTREGGVPFLITRANRWADLGDVASPPAFETADAVDALINQDLEPVSIDSVDFTSTVATEYRQSRITKVAVSVNGGKYVAPSVLRVKPGDKLKARVTLRPYKSTATEFSTVTLKVPAGTKGRSGVLSVIGGSELSEGLGDDEDGEDSSCLLTPEGCNDDTDGSLDSLFKSLTSGPRNDDIVASLVLEPASDSGNPKVTTAKRHKYVVITGSDEISVAVR